MKQDLSKIGIQMDSNRLILAWEQAGNTYKWEAYLARQLAEVLTLMVVPIFGLLTVNSIRSIRNQQQDNHL